MSVPARESPRAAAPPCWSAAPRVDLISNSGCGAQEHDGGYCRALFSCYLTAVRVLWKPGKCQAVRPPGSWPASEPWQERLGPRHRRGERRQSVSALPGDKNQQPPPSTKSLGPWREEEREPSWDFRNPCLPVGVEPLGSIESRALAIMISLEHFGCPLPSPRRQPVRPRH